MRGAHRLGIMLRVKFVSAATLDISMDDVDHLFHPEARLDHIWVASGLGRSHALD